MKILQSFHYVQTLDLREWLSRFVEPQTVFLDSGAFSAHSQGATIDLDAYCRYIDTYRDLLWVYASLDAIGDDVQSRKNWLTMRSRGLDPLPVFHGGEPWKVLEEYCEACDYVALGGMVGASHVALNPWLVKAFRIGEKHGTRFHGFGQTKWPVLRDFPWWTVDSSSWLSPARFGTVKLFDVRAGKWVTAGTIGSPTLRRHGRLIREHGVDPALLDDRDRYESIYGAKIGAVAWWRAESWLQRRHSVHPPPSRSEVGVGTNVVYAMGGGLGSRDIAALNYCDQVRLGAGPNVFFANVNLDLYPPLANGTV